MNKLIIAGVVASVALFAFVLFTQSNTASKGHVTAQATSLSTGSLHLAISQPVPPPKDPPRLPAGQL